jgi:microcystin-dependent protein
MPIEQKAYDSTIMGGVPYYDDFDQQKKFLKMLFKPGLPVQARELSQAQTILQNQIERFGSHVFQNGSVVLGGGVSTSSANFVRLTSELPLATLKRLINQKVRVTKSDGLNVDAIVCGYADKSTLENDAFQILFVKYITVGEYESGERVFTIGTGNIGVEFTVLDNATTPGSGFVQTFVTVDQGVFYVDGYFCIADSQSAAATKDDSDLGYRTFLSTNSSVGFNAQKTVVDAESDSSLRDPSFGFNNFNAPGADRYKIDLVLMSRSLTGSGSDSNSYKIADPTNFFELVRVIDGQVTKKIKYPELAELEKTLARRTFDESGNYTTVPFEIEIGSHEEIFGSVDESKFGVKLSPGKAYVSGFEFETIAPTLLTIDKSSSTLSSSKSYRLVQGSYFGLSGVVQSADFDSDASTSEITGITLDGFIDNTTTLFTDGNPVDLLDLDGEVVGSCVPTHLLFGNEGLDASARLYFHSKTFNTGKTDLDVKRISKSVDSVESFGITVDFTPSGPDTIVTQNAKRITNIAGSGSVEKLQNPVRWTTIKAFKGKTNSSGVVGFTSGIGSKDFFATVGTDSNSAQIRPVGILNVNNSASDSDRQDKCVLVRPILVPTIDNTQSTISLNFGKNAPNRDITCFLPMSYDSISNIRKKTVSGETTVTVNTNDELNKGTNTLSLGVTDVKEIVAIREVDTVTDVKDKFILNTGQNDFTYELSSIELKDPADTTLTRTSDYVVTFKQFLHTGDGPFTKDSYTGVKASELPATGSEGLNPFDILDFRPVRSSTGNYDQGTSEPTQTPFSSLATPSFVTVSTFLPRIDSVVLTKERKLVVVSGFPDQQPQPPMIAGGDLELYRVRINGADSDAQTLQVETLDSQRFTMSDIGELETRTTDDFVENYKKSIRSNMVARGNAAFVNASVNEDDVYIDDLLGYENVDSVNENCNVSFDPIKNQLRPAFKTTALTSFSFDDENNPSTGVTFSTDGVALSNFNEPAEDYVLQNSTNIPASSVNINPFGINDYLGSVKLTPHRAKYWSETKRARVVGNIRGELNSYESDVSSYDNQGRRLGFGTVYRDWEVFWCGIEERSREIEENKPNSRIYNSPRKTATINRILSEKVKKTVSNRIIDLSIRPYLDTFTLQGVVENVLPGATFNLLFDGVQQNLSTETYQASTGPQGGGGTFDFTVVIPADTYTIGKKLVRVVSGSPTNSVVDCDSSADEIFYGEGRPDTTLFGDNLVRPVTLRRKSAKVEEIADEYFSDIFETSNSTVINALTPVSQTFNVDAEKYPNGIFVNKIDLWFTEKGSDVTLRIHPTRGGNPLTSIVMPFGEVTSVTKTAQFTTNGLIQDVIDSSSTDFEFTTPVYLPAGEYSLSVSSNDTGVNVVTYDETAGDSPIRPVSILNLYLPQNDGSVVGYDDQYMACKISKCAFDVANNNNFRMSASSPVNTLADAIFIATNPPVVSELETSVTILNGEDTVNSNVSTNTTVDSLNYGGNFPLNGTFNLDFTMRSNGDVSTVVDTESVSAFIPAFDLNAIASDEEGNDDGSAVHFRYYTKVVETDAILDGIVVSIDGLFRGLDDLRVYIRRAIGDEDIFSNAFVEVPLDGDSDKPGIDSKTDPLSLTYGKKFDGIGERFSRYQIKVVGQRATGDTGRDNPFINFLGVAPTRSAASFTIDGGGGGTPTSGIARGMVLPFLGKDTDPILQGSDGVAAQFLLCDGTFVSNTTYFELKTTLEAAGVNPVENDKGQFQIPDLRGRTLVGTGNLLDTDQTVGTAIGSEEVDLTGASFTATMNTTTATGGGSGNPAIVTKSVGSVTPNDTLITVSANDADTTNSKNVQPSFVVRYIIKT